jgi:4-diphosphocytidyl-2-C-methyl-D-erythritol kinase
MSVSIHSFAKINIGLRIGASRVDGFHELRTLYQTVALHDTIRVSIRRGAGIEIRCDDPRVPTNETNTCYRIAERALPLLKSSGRVVIEIEKRIPVQGGLGGASSNAVAVLLALEQVLKKQIPYPDKLRITAEVGSDLPQFLVGGTVLGVGRGEEVYPATDLASVACIIVTPAISISTPKAFADWDLMVSGPGGPKLTLPEHSDRMVTFGRKVSAWLSGWPERKTKTKLGRRVSGVPARGRGRAEILLLDLVRTGIENDFERVVFPQYPELGEVKCLLQRAGAAYASLSGSGSAVYGLFGNRASAQKAAARLRNNGLPAQATRTLTRREYWKRIYD